MGGPWGGGGGSEGKNVIPFRHVRVIRKCSLGYDMVRLANMGFTYRLSYLGVCACIYVTGRGGGMSYE